MTLKKCTKCLRHKALDKFDPHPTAGTHTWCKACREIFRALINPKCRKKLFLTKDQKRLRVNRLRREKYRERVLMATITKENV